jgi:hypothetical protein
VHSRQATSLPRVTHIVPRRQVHFKIAILARVSDNVHFLQATLLKHVSPSCRRIHFLQAFSTFFLRVPNAGAALLANPIRPELSLTIVRKSVPTITTGHYATRGQALLGILPLTLPAVFQRVGPDL